MLLFACKLLNAEMCANSLSLRFNNLRVTTSSPKSLSPQLRGAYTCSLHRIWKRIVCIYSPAAADVVNQSFQSSAIVCAIYDSTHARGLCNDTRESSQTRKCIHTHTCIHTNESYSASCCCFAAYLYVLLLWGHTPHCIMYVYAYSRNTCGNHTSVTC